MDTQLAHMQKRNFLFPIRIADGEKLAEGRMRGF
jgi:hypothetical protein